MSSERLSTHFTGLPRVSAALRGDQVLDVAGGLRAEPPPTHGQTIRSCAGVEAEHRGIGAMDRVRRLVRHPHRDPAVLGNGDDAVGLHRHAGQTLTDHRDLGDRVGTLARIAAVLAELGGEADVRAGVGEQQRGVGRQPVGGGEHDRQRLDVGEHLLCGVVGLRLRFGDHGSDHVADEAHPITGEDRPVVVGRQHREALHRRHAEVVAGVEHGDDTRHRRGAADVDRVDRAVGDLRPNESPRRACRSRRGRRRTCLRRSAASGPPAGAPHSPRSNQNQPRQNPLISLLGSTVRRSVTPVRRRSAQAAGAGSLSGRRT